MPLHDWTRVPSGLFHHFHQDWSIEICRTLNRGMLPDGLAAFVEQSAGTTSPDVLAIELDPLGGVYSRFKEKGETATMVAPSASIVRRSDKEIYSDLANRIAIRHHLGEILAIIEILSPGNKDSRSAITDLVEKTVAAIRKEIHVMLVDLFPPSKRDPHGIHKLVWDEIEDEPFEFPLGKDRLIVSYEGGKGPAAYIEPLAVGDPLPEMPLMLTRQFHIKIPLESTYYQTWKLLPQALRTAVETGKLPMDRPEQSQ